MKIISILVLTAIMLSGCDWLKKKEVVVQEDTRKTEQVAPQELNQIPFEAPIYTLPQDLPCEKTPSA